MDVFLTQVFTSKDWSETYVHISTVWKGEVQPISEEQQVRDCLQKVAVFKFMELDVPKDPEKVGLRVCVWQFMVSVNEAGKFPVTGNNKCFTSFLEKRESGERGELFSPIPKNGIVHIILESVGLDDF